MDKGRFGVDEKRDSAANPTSYKICYVKRSGWLRGFVASLRAWALVGALCTGIGAADPSIARAQKQRESIPNEVRGQDQFESIGTGGL
ncbi:hypothetical protein LBMAG48_11270 [Phycisphaerae bacterium]|nr:hypothetical protein LBMAG48_11270 [Phycisphaerae bacterium]